MFVLVQGFEFEDFGDPAQGMKEIVGHVLAR